MKKKKKKPSKERTTPEGVVKIPERWKDYLFKNGWAQDEYALILARNLRDPRRADPKWFEKAISALKGNHQHRGAIWRQYEKTGKILYPQVLAAIRAYERHTKTHYNEYLLIYRDKDRAMAEVEKEQGKGRLS